MTLSEVFDCKPFQQRAPAAAKRVGLFPNERPFWKVSRDSKKPSQYLVWSPKVVWLCDGQVYVMEENTGAFDWWHFECRDTVTRFWGSLFVPCIQEHHLLLQHDNAGPHDARICTQFLETEIITVLSRPAYSPPDVSPIRGVWYALDQRIWRHVPVPANFAQPFVVYISSYLLCLWD